MGTIAERHLKNGQPRFTAQILKKQGGVIVLRESKSFGSRGAAETWIKTRERALARPGALAATKATEPTLADTIDRYLADTLRQPGRTKAQVLASLRAMAIAEKKCSAIDSSDIVALAADLAASRKPQTVANYLSHLGSIFAIAQPAWGHPLDASAMKDAAMVAKRLGYTSKSRERDRRPTLAELDLLLQHFARKHASRPGSAPMHQIVAFALFSTRRLEELTRITWEDFDIEGRRVLVRDMKHPGDKAGNNVWCDVPPEAVRITLATSNRKGRIFPHEPGAISASFTRAMQILEIDDLHLHDLRHEGVSRLFEMGRSIPQVAAVSGHRSWVSLKRYAHLRQGGDKFEGWPWLEKLAPTEGKLGA
jgi:integrase